MSFKMLRFSFVSIAMVSSSAVWAVCDSEVAKYRDAHQAKSVTSFAEAEKYAERARKASLDWVRTLSPQDHQSYLARFQREHEADRKDNFGGSAVSKNFHMAGQLLSICILSNTAGQSGSARTSSNSLDNQTAQPSAQQSAINNQSQQLQAAAQQAQAAARAAGA